MSDPRWERAKALFDEAASREGDARAAFLADACAGDDELSALVERLLDADAQASQFLETPATIDPDPADAPASPAGRRLGPYRLDREIGRGGMGVVYEAVRTDGFEKRVAIKLMRRGLNSAAILRRFEQERQTLARLEHPNIARLLDGGADDQGRPFVVMEFISGAPLDRFCAERRLGVHDRLRLFRQVCDAVQFAHQNLVVHRDLKPVNVLVDASGSPKLVDFGIAKLLGEAPATGVGATRHEERLMTPAYASPEQMRGEPVSTATDVYSLGVMLCELLTRKRPYDVEGLSSTQAERLVCDMPTPLPSALVTDPPADGAPPLPAAPLRRSLRGDLDVIVQKAMQKTPERRYASVEQLSADIGRHLSSLPVLARPDSVVYRFGKFYRRHRAAVVAGTIAAAAIVVGAAAASWQAREAQREAAKARRVSEFVQDLFLSADPWQGRRDITMREALDVMERRTQDFNLDPELAAPIERALGIAYGGVGEYAKAESHLLSALEAARAAHGDAHEDTIAALTGLGALRHVQGRHAESERLLRESIATARAALPARHPRLLDGLRFFGVVLTERGAADEAEATLHEAIEIMRGDQARRRELAETLVSLGVNVYNRGRLSDAEAIYREAIDAFRALPRPNPDVATALQNLGVVYRLTGRAADAEAAFREAVSLRVTLLGPEHPAVAIVRVHLGDALMRRGDLNGARTEIEQALALQRKTLAPGHLDLARLTAALGLLEARSGRPAVGEPLLREALDIRRRLLPEGHWLTATIESALGECLLRQGRLDEADPLLARSLETLTARLGPEHATTREAAERVEALRAAMQKRSSASRPST